MALGRCLRLASSKKLNLEGPVSTENLPMGQEHNRGRDHIPKVNYGDLGLVRIHDTQARAGRPWCYLLGNYGDLFYLTAVLGMKPRASACCKAKV